MHLMVLIILIIIKECTTGYICLIFYVISEDFKVLASIKSENGFSNVLPISWHVFLPYNQSVA